MRKIVAALTCAGVALAAGDVRLIDAVKRRDHQGIKALIKDKAGHQRRTAGWSHGARLGVLSR